MDRKYLSKSFPPESQILLEQVGRPRTDPKDISTKPASSEEIVRILSEGPKGLASPTPPSDSLIRAEEVHRKMKDRRVFPSIF